jgi:hypothetical protein
VILNQYASTTIRCFISIAGDDPAIRKKGIASFYLDKCEFNSFTEINAVAQPATPSSHPLRYSDPATTRSEGDTGADTVIMGEREIAREMIEYFTAHAEA